MWVAIDYGLRYYLQTFPSQNWRNHSLSWCMDSKSRMPLLMRTDSIYCRAQCFWLQKGRGWLEVTFRKPKEAWDKLSLQPFSSHLSGPKWKTLAVLAGAMGRAEQ